MRSMVGSGIFGGGLRLAGGFVCYHPLMIRRAIRLICVMDHDLRHWSQKIVQIRTRAALGVVALFACIAVSGVVARVIFEGIVQLCPSIGQLPLRARNQLISISMVLVFAGIYALVNRAMARAGSQRNAYAWLVDTVQRAVSGERK
jgi:hypothetical protein